MLLTAVCITANAQVKEFERYSDTKNVTYVYISKFMLQMAGKKAAPSVQGVNLNNIMHKLTGIQIITAEEKNAAARLKTETLGLMKNGKYELLMQVDENEEKVRIFHKEGKQQSVIVMLTEETDQTTIIVFSGKFTMDDVMKMSISPSR